MKVDTVRHVRTNRLVSEPVCFQHFNDLHRLHHNPQVLLSLSPDGRAIPDEVTRYGLLSQSIHWKKHGFGLWVFYTIEGGEFVGRGGLKHCPMDGQPEVELGYAIMPAFWGNGYATEIASVSLEVAFSCLGLDSVVAFTLPTNIASRRVMEKVGLRYEKNIIHASMPHVFYRIRSKDWLNNDSMSHPFQKSNEGL